MIFECLGSTIALVGEDPRTRCGFSGSNSLGMSWKSLISWLTRVWFPGTALERLLLLLRFNPQMLLWPLLGHGISLVTDPGNLDKNHTNRRSEEVRDVCIRLCSIPSTFLIQDAQVADLSARLVPIYSRPNRRPSGARYFKLREGLWSLGCCMLLSWRGEIPRLTLQTSTAQLMRASTGGESKPCWKFYGDASLRCG